ncbi:MAG: O-antigen ligase family protein [Gaiella sp.]
MASQPVPSALPQARGAVAETRISAGAAVLAVAIPILFVHEQYQPTVGLSAGGTSVDVSLADAAVAAVVGLALWSGLSRGFAPLARGRWLWWTAGALCLVAVASVAWPVLRDDPYDWRARLVAAAGFVEYALLAVAVPLLARTRRDATLALAALIATSVAATSWAALQFAGLVDEFSGRRPGQREPSFVGIHDFAALSGLVLVVALVVLLTRERPVPGWLAVTAGIAGSLGVVLAGAMTGVFGLVLAAVALVIVAARRFGATRRQVLATVGIVLAVGAGTATMRGTAIGEFAEFLGIRPAQDTGQVESYAQRTVLAYIGLRIFLDHPLVGAGFQASNDEFAYAPHLAAARARFPDQPEEALPSPEHPWGVQNLPIAVLADWGLLGFALLLGVFVSGLRCGLRRAPTVLPLVGAGGILVAAGVWNGLGVVPAIPLAAMTWLSFGLAVADD